MAKPAVSDMMNILNWYRSNKEKKQAIRFANDLAFHMHSVYAYLLHQNHTLQSGSCIKEALGLLDNWKKVSDNLYEHKPTGLALEVRPESKLLPMTKAVLDIEFSYIFTYCPESERAAITNEARALIDDYFSKNSVIDRFAI